MKNPELVNQIRKVLTVKENRIDQIKVLLDALTALIKEYERDSPPKTVGIKILHNPSEVKDVDPKKSNLLMDAVEFDSV